jgi:hypothetical protein
VFRGQGALLPISSPGIISIPLGFLVTWVVSMMTQPKGEAAAEADTLFDRIGREPIRRMPLGPVRLPGSPYAHALWMSTDLVSV